MVGAFDGARFAADVPREIGVQFDRKVAVGVFDDDELVVDGNLDAELFFKFARDAFLDRFVRFLFAAGEFP